MSRFPKNSKQEDTFRKTTTDLQGFFPEKARLLESLRMDQGFVHMQPAGKHNSGIEPTSMKWAYAGTIASIRMKINKILLRYNI